MPCSSLVSASNVCPASLNDGSSSRNVSQISPFFPMLLLAESLIPETVRKLIQTVLTHGLAPLTHHPHSTLATQGHISWQPSPTPALGLAGAWTLSKSPEPSNTVIIVLGLGWGSVVECSGPDIHPSSSVTTCHPLSPWLSLPSSLNKSGHVLWAAST